MFQPFLGLAIMLANLRVSSAKVVLPYVSRTNAHIQVNALSGGNGHSIGRFVSTRPLRGGSTTQSPEDSPESNGIDASMEQSEVVEESTNESVASEGPPPSPPAEETKVHPQIPPTTTPEHVNHDDKVLENTQQ